METAYIAANQRTLLSRLLESEHKFTAAAAVSEPCATVRPAEGSWSVLFLLIAAHPERHTRQIEAVKGSAAYRAAKRQQTAS